jgi:hypothetical protein
VADFLTVDEPDETVYVIISILPSDEITQPVVSYNLVQKDRRMTAHVTEKQGRAYEEVILSHSR